MAESQVSLLHPSSLVLPPGVIDAQRAAQGLGVPEEGKSALIVSFHYYLSVVYGHRRVPGYISSLSEPVDIEVRVQLKIVVVESAGHLGTQPLLHL